MTIKNKNEMPSKKPEIDLNGPDGNAFCLMGYAKQYAKQLCYNREKIDEIIRDMMAGDYEHLLEVFENHFGEYVTLYR